MGAAWNAPEAVLSIPVWDLVLLQQTYVLTLEEVKTSEAAADNDSGVKIKRRCVSQPLPRREVPTERPRD